jgi:MFS family permease
MHLNIKGPFVFYGWWIVGAGFLVNLFVAGVVNFGFTALFEPIVDEFGWSYAQVSLAASLRGLEVGILAPVVGLLVDRIGPRKLIFGGALLLGIGLTLLSLVNNLAMFYVAFALVAAGMSACIGTVTMTTISHWFRRKVSIAMGIAACGVAVGGLVVPLMTFLIDDFGWRTAVLYLGLGICGLIALLSLLFRHKPEQYGYLPDGDIAGTGATERPFTPEPAQIEDSGITLRQVIKKRYFWQIAFSYMGHMMVVSSVVTHIMPYLSSIGIARSSSSIIASAMPVVTIVGRLCFGWCGDRFSRKWLTATAIVVTGLGMLSLAYMADDAMWLALLFIVIFGIGYGGSATMLPVLVREYFGRGSFGIAYGFVVGIVSVGQILGPTLAGWVFDTWESYQGIWLAFTALIVVISVIIATLPQVKRGIQTADKYRT